MNNKKETAPLHDKLRKEIILRIKNGMMKKGCNQEKLGNAIGITQNAVSRVLCAQTGLKLDVLIAIAATLEIPMEELIFGSASQKVQQFIDIGGVVPELPPGAKIQFTVSYNII